MDERILDLQFLVCRREAVQTAVRIPAQLRLQQIARDEWLRQALDIDLISLVKEQVEQELFFQTAMEREEELDGQITKLVEELEVFWEVFAPIDGMGPILGGRMIAEFVDVRRYPTPSKMLAYTGWHLRDTLLMQLPSQTNLGDILHAHILLLLLRGVAFLSVHCVFNTARFFQE